MSAPWVIVLVLACTATLGHTAPAPPPEDPRAACLRDRVEQQRAALAITDPSERARRLAALPDCGPPPAPPAPAEPASETHRHGTPPLSWGRVGSEVGWGLAAEAGAVLLGFVLPCEGSLCGTRVEDAVYFAGPLLGMVAMPIAVGVVGNRGDQNGSILLMLAGVQVGVLASVGLGQLDTKLGFAGIYTLPLGFAVLGFNAWRDYDDPEEPVSTSVTRRVVPAVIRSHDTTLFALGGTF